MEIILGSIVSLVIQFLKNKYGSSEMLSLATVVGLSLAAAVVYSSLNYYGLFETFSTILMSAGAFYTFIIKRF